MKHGQNVCLDEISDKFGNGSCWVKNRSLGHMREKPCVRSRGHIFRQIIMKLRTFVLIKSRTNMKMGHVGSKTRSLGQILEKPCVCSRDQIFGLILKKLYQSFCLDKILYMFENGRSYACNRGAVI